MPKNKREKSALKRAREFFPQNFSDTEESDSSVESNHDLAHIPIKDTPEIKNLTIEFNMEQIGQQLAEMAANLNNLLAEQQRQQQLINALGAQQAGQAAQAPAAIPAAPPQHANFFAIPDPIKHGISKFDGNKKQLNAWLSSVETTLQQLQPYYTDDQNAMFLRTIINGKIEGRAKDKLCANGNPTTFEEVKSILIHHLGDHQDLTFYKCQLWQHVKTPNTTLYSHYNSIKETIQIIKNLSQQDPDYRTAWNVMNKSIEQDALAAFLAGLPKDMFGHAIAAKPVNIEEAYAFVCKFKSSENLANNISNRSFQKNTEQNKIITENKPQKFKINPHQQNNSQGQQNKNDEPMEIGSTNSRLTLNRRQFNNNENLDENTSESEEESVDLNFCWATGSQTET